MNTKIQRYSLFLVMITLFSLTNPIQAGWLDKNLDKLKKAKDLLNSAPKINQLKNKKDDKKPEKPTKKAPENKSKKINTVKNQHAKATVTKKPNKNKEAALIPDETVKFKLSNDGSLKILILPSYKGIIINAGQSFRTPYNKLKKPQGLSMSQFKIKVARIRGKRTTDYQTYHRLFAIQQTYKSLNKAQLKKAFYKSPEYKSQQQYANLLSWKKTAGYLAVSALSDKSYRKYFCGKNDCNSAAKLQLDRGHQSRYVSSGVKLHWGGIMNKNEFKTRRLISQFIDNEFSQLVQWSKNHKFNREEYVYRETKLPPYNFQQGIFDIRIKLEPYQLAKGTLFNNKIKMTDSEAETLAKQHKHKQIFYGFKVNSTISQESYIYKSKMLDVNNIKFNYVITSNAIDLFWKANLTDKWVSLPVSRRASKSKANSTSFESKRNECLQSYKDPKTQNPYARRCLGLCNKNRLSDASANSINRCNNAYDSFKNAQNKPSTKKMHLDEVTGIFRRGRGMKGYILKTNNPEFKPCSGYRENFQMLNDKGNNKIRAILKTRSRKIKLINVNWTINLSGNPTSRCVATDVKVIK